jgi:chromosome segregation ATPase
MKVNKQVSDPRTTLAALLDKIQSRLIHTADKTRQNSDEIAALRDETRLKVGTLQRQVGEKTGSIETSIETLEHQAVTADKKLTERVDAINELRIDIQSRLDQHIRESVDKEAKQTLRDQSNVQSLTNLRDSVQKAFNQVKDDVASLLKTIQRLNERVGQVESQNLSLASAVSLLQNRMDSPAPAPQMPSDHVWINRKLSGVYDTTTDLEARLQKLEAGKEVKQPAGRAPRTEVVDGQTLVVYAKAPITVSDPADEFPIVAQVYRVVADRVGPTLSLIPISSPVRITQKEAREAGLK